ncbi:hypothetical protein [Demequina litorisediminis]|uniref:hypothetical protein n=1 Tax=Demequina litorisediminis TaxID=1849022 RepID=UPI0024E0FF92|nr:hypothetical protein [Demequina litorisediminis]
MSRLAWCHDPHPRRDRRPAQGPVARPPRRWTPPVDPHRASPPRSATSLPRPTRPSLAQIFATNANSGDLVRYLEAFAHTCAVMQTATNLRRVAREAVVDLAADGVIYAEPALRPRAAR